MATQRLPFPVPDERAHYFVGSYADMHDLAWDLVVPAGVPESAATVLRTARELLRQSYYCYELSTVAVMHSLIAVEIVLRDRIPDAGTKPLFQIIKQGADSPAGCRRAAADFPAVRRCLRAGPTPMEGVVCCVKNRRPLGTRRLRAAGSPLRSPRRRSVAPRGRHFFAGAETNTAPAPGTAPGRVPASAPEGGHPAPGGCHRI
ncbi:hypothetical protein [Streptomyces gobitricini]|uniref:Uncharacterized protein n=1 Tax=Streptomyces gobitricini TaxID=68211 RepID=A0ABN3NDA8_9ACTN